MENNLFQLKPGGLSVYEILRNLILSTELKPGERIREQQLADQFGVSRTPVREALKRLEIEKLVEVLPHKGVFVARINSQNVIELFQVRAVLEGLAARLAVDNIGLRDIERMEEQIILQTEVAFQEGNKLTDINLDYKFHEIIWKENSNNHKLIEMLTNITEQIMRHRILSLGVTGRAQQVIIEHKAIVKALRERNKEEAELVIRRHIEAAQETLIKQFTGKVK